MFVFVMSGRETNEVLEFVFTTDLLVVVCDHDSFLCAQRLSGTFQSTCLT